MTEDETRREAAAGAEEPNHQAEDDHSSTEKKDFVPSAPPPVEEVLDNKSAQERVNAKDEDLSAPSSNRTPLSEVFSANDGQIKPTGQETVDLDKKMTEESTAAEQSEKDKEVESTVTDPEPKEGKLKEKVAKKSKKQKDKSGKDAAKGDEDENKSKKGVDMVDDEGAAKGKAEIDAQSMVDDKEEDKQMKQGKGLQSLEKDEKKDKKAEKKSKEDEGAKKEKQKSDKKNGKENGEAKGEKKKEKKEKKEKKNKGSSERIQKKLEKMNAKIGRILAKKDEYVQRLKEAQEKERLEAQEKERQEAQEKERQEAENRAPQEREDSAATLGKSENDKGGNDWRRESLTEEECLAKLEEGLVEVVQKQPSGSLSRTHSVVPPPPEEEDLAEVREVLKDLPDLKISDDSEQTTSGLQEWSDDNETKHAPQSDSPTKAPITSEGKDYSTQLADSKAGGDFRREAGMIL